MKKQWIATVMIASVLTSFGLPISGAMAKENVREKIESIRKEKESVLDEIAKTNSKIAEQKRIMDEAQAKIEEIEKEVGPVLKEIREIDKELKVAESRFHKRLRYLYMNGETHYMANLLSARSFNDFLQKFEVVRLIAKQDYNQVETYLELIREREKGIEEYVELQKKQQAEIDKSNKAVQALLEELKKSNSKLSEIEEAEELYEDEIIEINLEEWRNGTLRRPYTGPLKRPISTRMTSGYGYRIHPIYKTRRFHAGIDYGGPTGVPVYAAADGVVVSSRASGGYGWLITIYHGHKNGVPIFTRYAHSYPKQVRVLPGQEVKAGEQITSVGNNGASTAPHLHFEVRIGEGQQAVNPLNYMQ